MNTKYLVVVVAMAIMLIGATALANEDAFATKKNQNSQATSQVNDCGNDILPENVGCQNTDAQIQGDENNCTSNSLTADQVFPDERNDGEIQAFQIPGESEAGLCGIHLGQATHSHLYLHVE